MIKKCTEISVHFLSQTIGYDQLIAIFSQIFEKNATAAYEKSLYEVKAFENIGKEMRRLDDGSIVDLYLKRDEEAISKTTEKYGKQLWRVAHNIVKDAQGAEECVNDTYLAAWNSIPPHEPREYLFAFLARIARHIALDFCKQRNRLKRQTFLCELNTELEQCIPSSDDVGEWTDSMVLCELINRFLATLGDEGRNVFVRRYWFMDSVTDISHRYGLSQSKVKSILFRSRNQLRQFLEKEGYKI